MSLRLEQLFPGDSEKETNPRDGQLIGFHDSPSINYQLNLMAVAEGVNKSRLLRRIVSEWLTQHDPLQTLIKKVKELRHSEEAQELTITEFKAKIKLFLQEKKVHDDTITKVLKSI